MEEHLELKMVLQSDDIEEPFLVPTKNLSNQGSLKKHFL